MNDELRIFLRESDKAAQPEGWMWPPGDTGSGFPALLVGLRSCTPILLDAQDPRSALRLRTGAVPLPVWSRRTVAFWSDSTELWRSCPNPWARALLIAWRAHDHEPTCPETTVRAPEIHGPCVVTGLHAGHPTAVPREFRCWLERQIVHARNAANHDRSEPRQ